MNTLVEIKKHTVVCSSIQVAKNFDKNHFHIIRDLETKIIGVADKNFTDTNFGLSEYKDESGKRNKMYFMTRDGFTLLAMGFTGVKAMKWKIKYINSFNKMEQLLLEKQTEQWQQTRLQSKANRRLETDEIKELIEYAKAQGSKNMEKQGYVIYSKLANKVCGINDRNNATVSQLNNLVLVENILKNCIKNGIEENKHYKEIYQDCKNRLNQFLEITYLKIAG